MSETTRAVTPAGVAAETADETRSWLWNKDLAAIPREKRTWGTYNYTALWVAMSINIPTYMLASGMIAGGMNWKQALFTIFLGNVIVLIPMLLNAHAGARYGIPFPVFARSSFGVLGANIPALLRALVACGWFGIQTWIGGQAINALLAAIVPGWGDYPLGEPLCFGVFWLLNLYVVIRGIDTIRFLQGISAPFLLIVGLVLLGWAYKSAGGFGPMLSAPSKFNTLGEFLPFFIPSLTGVVAFWATVALNIPDFTRYAKGQKQQMLGQALGLPATMTLFAFIGVAVTSTTIVLFHEPIWNPIEVLKRLEHPVAVVVAMVAIVLATLNVNIAANVVSPANDFSNIYPRRLSFKLGGVITCGLGLALQPWYWLANYSNYINDWLVGYSSLLGPIGGVLIADYFVLRKKVILVDDLYRRGGFYEFSHGFHLPAVLSLATGIAVALVGRFYAPLRPLFDYAWFVGFGVSFLLYLALMRFRHRPAAQVASH